jgi:hypothetical protein
MQGRMDNNLSFTPDGQLAFSLQALRGLTQAGRLGHNQHIVPGIFFSVDPDSSNHVEIDSQPGDLMRLRLVVGTPGRWLSLNLDAGRADLTDCGLVGFVLRSSAPVTATCRVCLRSGTEAGVSDAYFAKTVVSFPKTALHLDVLELDQHPQIPRKANWRELIFLFEVTSQEIHLQDLRFFVI